jgi:hypothetical protein
MNKYLQLIDIYGFKFNFTNFGNTTYKTTIGGLFSILTFGFLVALFVIFGRPFFLHLDPNVIVQTIDQDFYPTMNANFEKFPIAFRFENEKKGPANISDSLFPFLEIVRMKRNEEGYMTVNYTKSLNYTRCTEDLIKEKSVLSQIKDWSCVDWRDDNYTLGGTWDTSSQFAFYFKITIFYCKYDGVKYSNCTDFNTLNKLLNDKTKIYLSMMIPSVSITPSDYDAPLKTAASNIFFTLSPLLMRTDRYYYQTVEINQDVGWFTESKRIFTGYSMDKRDTDLQIRTIEDYNDPTKIKTIATAVFVLNNKLQQISVNFSKIQTFAANVGGVLKIIMEIARILFYFFNSSFIFVDIFYKLSEYEINDKKIKVGKTEDFSSANITNTLNKLELSALPISPIVNVNNFVQKNSMLKKVNLNYSNKNSSAYFFKLKVCCCRRSSKYRLYQSGIEKIKMKLDIINYLRLCNSYEILTKILFKKDQLLCLKMLSNSSKKLDDYSAYGDMSRSELNDLETYLDQDPNKLSETDKKLLDIYKKGY